MTIQQRAALNVAAFILTAIAGGIGTWFLLETFGLRAVLMLAAGATFLFIVKLAYDMQVYKLQALEELNKKHNTGNAYE
jgi:hypothetical protein